MGPGESQHVPLLGKIDGNGMIAEEAGRLRRDPGPSVVPPPPVRYEQTRGMAGDDALQGPPRADRRPSRLMVDGKLAAQRIRLREMADVHVEIVIAKIIDRRQRVGRNDHIGATGYRFQYPARRGPIDGVTGMEIDGAVAQSAIRERREPSEYGWGRTHDP